MEKEKTNKPYTKFILIFLIIQNIIILAVVGYGFAAIKKSFENIENTLNQTQNLLDEKINSVSEEMENAISQQGSLVSDFYYTLQPAPRGKIILTLSAQLKNYTNGSAASFSVTPDNGETSLVKTNISNNVLTANVTIPACETVNVGLVITNNQNTQSQFLEEIKNVSDCLTDHLFLATDLQVKQEGSDIMLSASINLINEYGILEEQQLDMVRLEITQKEKTLHTFYMSQDYENSIDGQDMHILTFDKIRTTITPNDAVVLSVRARDKSGFEYFCSFAEIEIDKNGIAGKTKDLATEFEIVE